MTATIVIDGKEHRFTIKSAKYVDGVLKVEGYTDLQVFKQLSLGKEVELKLEGKHLQNLYVAYMDVVSKKTVLWAKAKKLAGLLYVDSSTTPPKLKFEKTDAADAIVSDILSGTGFSIGSCPSDTITVEFDNDNKMSALQKIADRLDATLYFDDDKLYIIQSGQDKGTVSCVVAKIENDVETVINRVHAYSKKWEYKCIGNICHPTLQSVYVCVEDSDSINKWGAREHLLKIPLVGSETELQQIANAIIQEYKEPAKTCELMINHNVYMSKLLKPLDTISFNFEGNTYTLKVSDIEIRESYVKLVVGSKKTSIEDLIKEIQQRQRRTRPFEDGEGKPRYPCLTEDGFLKASAIAEPGVGLRPVLSFDGADDYVEVPDDPTLKPSNYITLSVRFKTADKTKDLQTLMMKWEGYNFCYRWDGTKPYIWFELRGTDDFTRALSTDSIVGSWNVENDVWYHVVATYDGTYMRVYVNGVLYQEKNVGSFTIKGTTARLALGQESWLAGERCLKGSLFEAQIYSRALTEDEIKWNYLHPDNPIRDGLVLWLKLDEGEGAKVYDHSGNGNDGMVNGASWVHEYVPIGLDYPTKVSPPRLLPGIPAEKADPDFGTTGDRIYVTTDTMFETSSTSYEKVWEVVVEAVDDVKNAITKVAASIRVGPEGGGGSSEPPGSEHICAV